MRRPEASAAGSGDGFGSGELDLDGQTPIGLRQLQVGQRARIVAVGASGELGRRIRDLGLTPGTIVAVIGRAPLRDPVALRLKAFTLTLRNSEADHITVIPLDPRVA